MGFLEQLAMSINEVVSSPSIKSVCMLGGTMLYSAVGGVQGAYLSLLFLVLADTVLGVATAIKFNEFSFKEWKKLPVKIVLYWVTIACAMHVDLAIASITYDVSWLDGFIQMYKMCILWFCCTELISIGKKVQRYGVHVPMKEIISTLRFMFMKDQRFKTSSDTERTNTLNRRRINSYTGAENSDTSYLYSDRKEDSKYRRRTSYAEEEEEED